MIRCSTPHPAPAQTSNDMVFPKYGKCRVGSSLETLECFQTQHVFRSSPATERIFEISKNRYTASMFLNILWIGSNIVRESQNAFCSVSRTSIDPCEEKRLAGPQQVCK